MSKYTSTRGKWVVAGHPGDNSGTDMRAVHAIGGVFSPTYVCQALKGDAALIAAAPELLRVCQLVVDLAALDAMPAALVAEARAAVEAATDPQHPDLVLHAGNYDTDAQPFADWLRQRGHAVRVLHVTGHEQDSEVLEALWLEFTQR
jgi:hypothetical protein